MNSHMKLTRNKIGVLITNIGTPTAPTPKAVRKYLNEFLSDRRIISLSPLLWQPILKGFILPFRSKYSSKLYQKIWTEQGSPLLTITEQQATHIQHYLTQKFNNSESEYEFKTVVGMRYGKPSIADGLNALKNFHAQQIIILPLFPHYSSTTTASTFDAVSKVLQNWDIIPQLNFVNDYHDDENYINALANSIEKHWQSKGKNQHLLFSFHGIPKQYVDAGDPYAAQCHKTTELVVNKLGLKTGEWSLAFQSRFGPKEWLKPYCVDVLENLAKLKVKSVDVVCPGFAADCLETLEEIAKTNKEIYMDAGGESFNYIPALNAGSQHVAVLSEIISQNLVLDDPL